jgi:hypothetical protein
MAIRRPSISSPEWLFQDFLYYDDPSGQMRYLQVKWDGEPYTRVSQTFDYSNPPYSNEEQRGGFIVAQIDYTLDGYLVTIDSWEVNWKDEWPLRLASNYLKNCMYLQENGYVIQVPKDAYAFWVSEFYFPGSNDPNTNLYSWRN